MSLRSNISRALNHRRESADKKLADALAQCVKASSEGYELAKKNANALIDAIGQMKSKLSDSMSRNGMLSRGSDECRKIIKAQYLEIIDRLNDYEQTIVLDLERRWQEKKGFSIVVFGRTMAWKSTLMSILTRGNEEFIGKGAQRTTRDVRRYLWKGLEVIDVPGIAAFGGDEDTRVAFDAAQSADLALFLMTDGGNTPEEVQGFADLRNSGKICLGVVNVQDQLVYLQRFPNEPTIVDEAIKGVSEKINSKDTYREIQCFAEKVSAKSSGIRIDFTIVHLLLSQLSQRKIFAQYAERMRKESQVRRLMAKICHEVVTNGPFFRVKGYVDGVVKPMVDGICILFSGSAINASQGRMMLDKVRQLKKWRDDFIANSDQRLKNANAAFEESMMRDIDDFAAENYENSDALIKWQKIMTDSVAYKKWGKVVAEIGEECSEKLREVQHEIEREFSFVKASAEKEEFETGDFSDSRKIWNWSVHALSSVLTAASLFTGGVTALIAGAVELIGGFFSSWFENKEEKIQRARSRLSTQVNKVTHDFCKKQGKNILDAFYEKIKRSRIDVVVNSQVNVTNGLFHLADAGRALAKSLIAEVGKINRQLVFYALRSLGYTRFADDILRVARIPGNVVAIALRDGARLPDEFGRKFSALMKERVVYVRWRDIGGLANMECQVSRDNIYAAKIMIKSILHNKCELNDVHIDPKLGIVHLQLDEACLSLTEKTELLNNIKLAEQITALHIVKEER